MLLEIGKTRVYVSFFFVAAMCMLLVTDRQHLFLYTVLSVVAHESGHIAAFKLMGRQIKSAKLTPFGMVLDIGVSDLSYKNEIQAAVCGPLVNLILCVIFVLNRNLPAAYINAALFLFNLLPVPQLDGGRILSALLSLHFSPSVSEKAVGVTGLLSTAIVFTLLFSNSGFGRLNITLLLSAAYLTFLSFSGCRVFGRKS